MSEPQKPSDDFLKASKALVYSRTSHGAAVGGTIGVSTGIFLTLAVIASSPPGGAHVTLAGLIGAMGFFGGTGLLLGSGVGFAKGSGERSRYIVKQLEAPQPMRALPPPPPETPLI